MKVLHLAPLWFPVSADSPGGRETFLAALIGELVAGGCESALVASGDSATNAELVPVVPENLYAAMAGGRAGEYLYYEQHQLLLALARADDFDLIHSHVGPGAYVLSAASATARKVLHTQHNPVYEDLAWFVGEHHDLWLSTVSEFQARRLREAGARRCETIPNGLSIERTPFSSTPGDGLVFIGRIEASKGADLAIAVAESLGRPIVLAGPIIDHGFFDREIAPRLGADVRYAGIVGGAERDRLFGGAACAVLPFRGPEGFGMVTIEAMACGTPVVALANGAVPEVVESGRTGYFSTDPQELPALVTLATGLDRRAVRDRVAARFDLGRVASRYRALYERIVQTSPRTSERIIR